MPELIVSDLDQAPGAIYNIPLHIIKLLFDRLQPSAPIKLAALKAAKRMFDPDSNVVGKESLAHLLIPHSKGKANTDPVSPTPLPRSTIISREFQSRFDALKGPCVVHQDM